MFGRNVFASITELPGSELKIYGKARTLLPPLYTQMQEMGCIRRSQQGLEKVKGKLKKTVPLHIEDSSAILMKII